MEKVSSGAKVLDTLLEGGFENGVITTLFGPAGSGKSNIALISALNIAEQGKKVAFVDTEGGFSVERIKQLSKKDEKQIMKNIFVLNPATFEEQKKSISKLKDLVYSEKVGLVVVDSIVMLYRLAKGSEEEIKITNKELASQLAVLSEIARKRNIPVLVTNQVYADFENKSNIHMIGGDLLKYWSKCIVRLDKFETGLRKASVYKHRSLPEGKSVYFEIIESGLKESQEPQPEKKKFSLF